LKVLLVTGKLAEPLIRQILNETQTQHTFDVLVLPLAVAAFLHPKYVASQIHLRGPLEEYNLILLPGMVSGDTDFVKKSVGIPTFKGTRYAADLPLLLDNLFDVESRLSTTQPADLVLADQLAKKARQDLAKGEKGPKKPLPKDYMEIGKGSSTVLIGPRMPMRVIAEITDAPLRSEGELGPVLIPEGGCDRADVHRDEVPDLQRLQRADECCLQRLRLERRQIRGDQFEPHRTRG